MRVVVAPLHSFPSGERRIVEVGGRSIGVFRVGESFYGIRNRCPHQGGPLCLGHLLGDVDGTAEFLGRFDDMIRGHHHHDALGILAGDEDGSKSYAGSSVAATRFTDNALGRQGRKLLAGLVAVQCRGDDPGALRRNLGLDAVDGKLK